MSKSIPFTLLGIGLFILFFYSKDLVYLENKNEIKTLFPSGIPYIDVIVSGPAQPNATAMVINNIIEELIEELKMKYDYMNLDTPPVGFVSGEFELA